MQVDEVEDPAPGPGELLLRAKAAAVNPVDLITRIGDSRRAKLLTLPYIPGDNIAGEVVAIGPDAGGFKIGQRVFGIAFNSYASLVVAKAAWVGELPEPYGYEEGAALPSPFFTAWNALVYTARVGAGETVLIHGGAGGVGNAAIQLAKRLGCRVLATVSSKEKADFCKSAGADEAINYREEDFAARCLELTGGRGADAIVEISAIENFKKDLEAICVNGRIVIVGVGIGKELAEANFRVQSLMEKNAAAHGIVFAHLFPRLPDLIRRFSPLLREGRFRMRVGRVFPLDEANEAHALLQSGKVLGKVVLKF
ncbi:MAG: hypothetical protein A3J27_05090 [Candidatus Tectomicrobia bacterium RIFCSPLOWO2_12_FULL_69_37]|nr:MAG: hypothetical protein A3I72_09415 [Candidatus Tectomicrobia bacterium RIFCSPLOWO2_02_FULL_70_19]OGL63861.1 MAG: hypothetical protein A3J27_05090 [Candidatus Tectomicrobia bacterium RIFCSPLOWO2_12_FULL_69_37]